LNVVPRRNLIQNIGFDEDATHTKNADPGLMIQAQNLSFPLTHPPAMIDWPEYAEGFDRRFTSPSLLRRVRTKLETVLSRATSSESKGF
jgi:hypothetical protein